MVSRPKWKIIFVLVFNVYIWYYALQNNAFDSLLNWKDSASDDYALESILKKKLKVLIVTEARSGSTFLGDLLQHTGSIYYSFEPLVGIKSDRYLRLIQSIFKCEFDRIFLQPVFWKIPYLKWNKLLRENLAQSSEYSELQLFNRSIHQMICIQSSSILVKTIRLSLNQAIKILKKSRENMKIIWLVRDPRSIMSSRLQLQWCKEMLNCTNSTVLCHKIESNIDSLESIEDNPRLIQSIRLIRYEDLIEDIYGSIKELFDYLGISKIPYEWINRHTSKDDILRNPHSTYRNIRKQKLTKAHWDKRLTSELIEDIESVCSKVMSQLGFDLLDQASTEDFAEKSPLRTYYPLQRFSIQIKKNKD